MWRLKLKFREINVFNVNWFHEIFSRTLFFVFSAIVHIYMYVRWNIIRGKRLIFLSNIGRRRCNRSLFWKRNKSEKSIFSHIRSLIQYLHRVKVKYQSYASNFTFLYQIKNSDVFNTLRSITEKARLDESEINTSKASSRDCRIFSPFSIIEWVELDSIFVQESQYLFMTYFRRNHEAT